MRLIDADELIIYRESSYGELHDTIYNKAIDDVMNKAKEIQEEQIKNLEQHPRRSGKQWVIYMNTHLGHIQIACKRIIEEQLKAGGENERSTKHAVFNVSRAYCWNFRA